MDSFNELKSALKTAPILGIPMHGCEYLMKVDASNKGIGCQLFQKQPIPFKPEFVGTLSEAEGLLYLYTIRQRGSIC